MEFYEKFCKRVGAPELFEKYKENFLLSIEDSKELTRVRFKSRELAKELEKAKVRNQTFWNRVKVGAVATTVGAAVGTGIFWYLTAAAAVATAPVTAPLAILAITAAPVAAPLMSTVVIEAIAAGSFSGSFLFVLGERYFGSK